MNRPKKIFLAGAMTIGIGAGAILFTPQAMNASSNVVLASVDWVTSQLNPMQSKLTQLEAKIAAQETEIRNLKSQIGNTTDPSPSPPQGEIPSAIYAAKPTVNIHSGATKSYKIVATRSIGTSLKVIDSFTSGNDLWYRVELSSSLKGWVHSADISLTKPSGASSVTVTANAQLRKGATTSYAVIQTLTKGTSVKYISSFTNGAGETWYNVETSSGIKGWMISTLGEVK